MHIKECYHSLMLSDFVSFVFVRRGEIDWFFLSIVWVWGENGLCLAHFPWKWECFWSNGRISAFWCVIKRLKTILNPSNIQTSDVFRGNDNKINFNVWLFAASKPFKIRFDVIRLQNVISNVRLYQAAK